MRVENYVEKLGLSHHVNSGSRPFWNSFDDAHQKKLLCDDRQAGVIVSLILTGSFTIGLVLIALAVIAVV